MTDELLSSTHVENTYVFIIAVLIVIFSLSATHISPVEQQKVIESSRVMAVVMFGILVVFGCFFVFGLRKTETLNISSVV